MMKKKLPSAVLALAILAPFAASSQDTATTAAVGPAVDASATGTVVFFREKKFAGAAVSYKVRENGVELCKLKSGTFCTVQASAGKHEYVVHSEAKDVLTLEVEPGETQYVVGGISVGFLAGHPNLSPSDKGAFESMKAKLKDNTGQDLDPPEKTK
jgi:uncharacterized membrane protein